MISEELKMETEESPDANPDQFAYERHQAHPEGFIRFGYRKVDSSVEFFVQDSGEGIPEDKIKMIFSRFVQLDDWSKGSDWDLPVCRDCRANERKDMGNLKAGRRIGLLCGFTFDT